MGIKESIKSKKTVKMALFLSATLVLMGSIGIGLVSCDTGGTSSPSPGMHATSVTIITQTAIGLWTENASVSALRTAAAYPAITPTPGNIIDGTAIALATGKFHATLIFRGSNDYWPWVSCTGTYEALFHCEVLTFDAQISSLGKVQVTLAIASGSTIVSGVRPTCFQDYEVGVMSATLNDTLNFIEQGTNCIKDKHNYKRFSIIGGTGKFQRATGRGLSSASYSGPDNHNIVTYTEQWDGTIQLS